MKKQYLVASFMISSLIVPMLANATTADEIKAQIQSLLNQIDALQQQLSGLTSDTSITTSTSSNSCPNLYRSLYRGARGSDVASLQRFLRSTGDFTYPEITNYYGSATERAVQNWQARNAVVSSGNAGSTGYGVVGPRTRAALQRCNPPISQVQTISQNGQSNQPSANDPQVAALNDLMNSDVNYPVQSNPTSDECRRDGTKLTEKNVLKIAESAGLSKPVRGWWKIGYNKSESFYQPETGTYPVVYACVWEVSLNLLPPVGDVSDYDYISGEDRVYVNDSTGNPFRLCRANGEWTICQGSSYN
jgi:peptidoglycan hydrolase-like protein with peptidoglycan-binding domain